MKYPNKQYIRLMQQKHGLKVYRISEPTYSILHIESKDGILIFRETVIEPQEKAWEELWIWARPAVEEFTGEKIFDVSDEMWERRQMNKCKSLMEYLDAKGKRETRKFMARHLCAKFELDPSKSPFATAKPTEQDYEETLNQTF